MDRIFINYPENDMRLLARRFYAIEDYRPGMAIFCKKGALWVTQTNDMKDHILSAGDEFTSSTRGKVLIEALRDSSVHIVARKRERTAHRTSLSQGRPA